METRPKEKKLLPLKVPAFLKKKPKSSPEDEETPPVNDETDVSTLGPEANSPASETKEVGVVYAELDLTVNPNLKPVVKGDDDKTEYAEIVYTQKEKKDEETTAQAGDDKSK